MPAEGIHLTALREAVALGALPPAARRACLRFEPAARLGAIAPDLPYFDRYLEELARYALRRPARASGWGALIHDGGAVSLVREVADAARRTRSELVAALALGLASHASIDRSIHPLVNALARRFPEGASPDASHREVEKFQSILFHERYLGADHMGAPGIVRLVAVPAFELLRGPAGDALVGAYARVTGGARVDAALARMARGYELHARVIGSPLGKRVAPPAEKERARPLFLEGGWGTFESVLDAAIRRSVSVLERAWGVFEADDADAPRALAALDEVLPAGTIEGQGLDVDLDQPFSIAGAPTA